MSASLHGMVIPSDIFCVLLLLAHRHLMPCEWRIVDGIAHNRCPYRTPLCKHSLILSPRSFSVNATHIHTFVHMLHVCTRAHIKSNEILLVEPFLRKRERPMIIRWTAINTFFDSMSHTVRAIQTNSIRANYDRQRCKSRKENCHCCILGGKKQIGIEISIAVKSTHPAHVTGLVMDYATGHEMRCGCINAFKFSDDAQCIRLCVHVFYSRVWCAVSFQCGSFVRSLARSFVCCFQSSNIWLSLYARTHACTMYAYMRARLPATQCESMRFDCVCVCVCGFFLSRVGAVVVGSRFKLNRHTEAHSTHSLSGTKLNENRSRQQQSQSEHSIDHVTHSKHDTVILLLSVFAITLFRCLRERDFVANSLSVSVLFLLCVCVSTRFAFCSNKTKESPETTNQKLI